MMKYLAETGPDQVLNLAGTEVAHLKGLVGTTSVRDIKRRLERQLKEEKKFSPMCLQGLCYKDQKLSHVVSHTGCCTILLRETLWR